MTPEHISPVVDPKLLRPKVSKEAVDVYRQTGLLIAPDFLSAEDLSALQSEANRLRTLAETGALEKWRSAPRPTVDGKLTWERIDPLVDISPAIEEFARTPAILSLAAALIDDEPMLWKDNLIYKLPGDRGYLLHQDQAYFQDFEPPPDKLVRIALALDPLTADNGTVTFYLGCHSTLLPGTEEAPRDVRPDLLNGERGWPVITDAGGLIAFHTMVPHLSSANRSSRTRRMLYLTYSAKTYGASRATYYAARRAIPPKPT